MARDELMPVRVVRAGFPGKGEVGPCPAGATCASSRRGGTWVVISDSRLATSGDIGRARSAVMPPASPPRHLLVPCLAKAAPDTAPVKTRCAVSVRRPKVSAQAGASGAKPAPVMATNRPPGARRASAERRCRAVASVLRASTFATAENGGFIRMTLGRRSASR